MFHLELADVFRAAKNSIARIVQQVIEAGHVVELPLPQPTHVAYYAAYPSGPQHPMINAFVDWLKTLF